MFTIQEVAALFNVTCKTVYNWIAAGRIKAVKIGNTIRISKEEVERIKQG